MVNFKSRCYLLLQPLLLHICSFVLIRHLYPFLFSMRSASKVVVPCAANVNVYHRVCSLCMCFFLVDNTNEYMEGLQYKVFEV